MSDKKKPPAGTEGFPVVMLSRPGRSIEQPQGSTPEVRQQQALERAQQFEVASRRCAAEGLKHPGATGLQFINIAAHYARRSRELREIGQ